MARFKIGRSTLWGIVLCLAGQFVAEARDTPGSLPATQSATPDAVVDAQIAAYNARDLEGFLSFYAEDAVLENYPDQVTETGKDEMRKRYQRSFSNPNIRAQIIERIVFDRFVIDHERVTGLPAGAEIQAVALYEVKEGKIIRVMFFEK